MSDLGPTSCDGQLSGPAWRHEGKDVNIRGLLITASGLVVVVVLAFLMSLVGFDYFRARDRESKVSAFPLAEQEGGRLPPEPRLEEIDRLEGVDRQLRQEQVLDTYGWVDEKAGIVRIPIRQAMKLIAAQGRQPK